MYGPARKITTAAIALALCTVPTGAIAAKAGAKGAESTATAVAPPASNPWITLSAMTSSSTAASSAAAQGYEEEGVGFPPLPVLAVILATIGVAIYILVADDDDDDGIGIPISP